MKTFLAFLLLLAASAVSAQSGELPLRPGDKITIAIGAVLDSEAAQTKGVYAISDNGTEHNLHKSMGDPAVDVVLQPFDQIHLYE